jgi:hypothetical protein
MFVSVDACDLVTKEIPCFFYTYVTVTHVVSTGISRYFMDPKVNYNAHWTVS